MIADNFNITFIWNSIGLKIIQQFKITLLETTLFNKLLLFKFIKWEMELYLVRITFILFILIETISSQAKTIIINGV